MSADRQHDVFTSPDAASLVSSREVGEMQYATVLAETISSMESVSIGAALRESLAQTPEGQARFVIIDLGRVGFINSQAIGMLVSVYSSALHRGAKLILSNVTKSVHEVLSVAKLLGVLNVCRTPEEVERVMGGSEG